VKRTFYTPGEKKTEVGKKAGGKLWRRRNGDVIGDYQ